MALAQEGTYGVAHRYRDELTAHHARAGSNCESADSMAQPSWTT